MDLAHAATDGEHLTYCRICQATCGLVVTVAGGQVDRVRGDTADPLSRGYTCPKGRRIGDFHADASRLRRTLMRDAAGDLMPVPVEEALDEVAARLRRIIERDGPEAVALYLGTQSHYAALTAPFAMAWLRSIGSPKLFTTMTIDQSAKWVADGRAGRWLGGGHTFDTSDVWLLIGSNPLVSLQGGPLTGFPSNDPAVRLKEAQSRGLRLLVIDPRRTQTATAADQHLQIKPGTDAIVLSAMLRLILDQALDDREFLVDHADGLADLHAAVRSVDVTVAAAVAGIDERALRRLANTFATARRGNAVGGTGPDMGPDSNLVEHLIRALNVVCGRYAREGEPVAHTGILSRKASRRAEVVPPSRSWTEGFRSRIGGVGMLLGELPTALLPEEITEPGPGRVRALVVSGGNPVAALPQPQQTAAALSDLELLVAIDPHLGETAALSDVVFAPALALERSDHTGWLEGFQALPYARFAEPVLARPPDVVEDWEVFWGLAARLNLPLRVAGHDIPMDRQPTSEELLHLVATGPVPLDVVRASPHGLVRPPDGSTVLPPRPSSTDHRFQLLPADVATELRAALDRLVAGSDPSPGDYTLTVRRVREVMNSWGRKLDGLPRSDHALAHLHPDDLQTLGLESGSVVTITSAHGSIRARTVSDPTLRRRVVSIPHCWSTDGDERYATTGALLSLEVVDAQSINRMPQLTAVSVRLSVSG